MRGTTYKNFTRIGKIHKNAQIGCAKMTYRNQHIELKDYFWLLP